MAYLPVSLPSGHTLISCPHWSCARSCVLEEGLCKEVADFLRLCIFKFERSRAGFSNLPTLPLKTWTLISTLKWKAWTQTDTQPFLVQPEALDSARGGANTFPPAFILPLLRRDCNWSLLLIGLTAALSAQTLPSAIICLCPPVAQVSSSWFCSYLPAVAVSWGRPLTPHSSSAGTQTSRLCWLWGATSAGRASPVPCAQVRLSCSSGKGILHP